IPRFHHLLLEIKKDFRKPRLLFGQGEYGFIHYLQSESSMNTFAMRVSDPKRDTRVTTRLVDGRIRNGLNFQFIRRLYEDQVMIAYRHGISGKEIRAEID